MPAVVLLSSGLDSTVNYKCALDTCGVALAVTFDYGQRAAAREIQHAQEMCRRHDVTHRVIALPWLSAQRASALLEGGGKLPEPKAAELDDVDGAAAESADAVWVPNRNGVFLNVGAALAEEVGADRIVVGFNAEEAQTFPDNTAAFLDATNHAMAFSTRGAVVVTCHTLDLGKAEVLVLGVERDAPVDCVWPCYRGDERLCGRCESCMRFLRAVVQSGNETWIRERHRRLPEGW